MKQQLKNTALIGALILSAVAEPNTAAATGLTKAAKAAAHVTAVADAAKPIAHQILKDGSSVLNLIENIKVVRPKGSSKQHLFLRVPKDKFAVEESILGHPRSLYDDFLSRHNLIVEKPNSPNQPELIVFESGEEQAKRSLKWTDQGELKEAKITSPRLTMKMQNSENHVLKIDYYAANKSNPHLEQFNKTKIVDTQREIQLPADAKLESYDLESDGKLRLHLRRNDGTYESMDVALGTPPASTPGTNALKVQSVESVR